MYSETRQRVPCDALRRLPVPGPADAPHVTMYQIFPKRLPNAQLRQTRFIAEAAVRLPGGLSTLACIVKIGDSTCLEVEGDGWDRRGRRVPLPWDTPILVATLRQMEQQHIRETARLHARTVGRN